MPSFVANGKTYLINSHSWRRIRQIDIDIADIVRIIEAGENAVKFRHKIEYVGCYTPRWAQRKGEPKLLAVKIVVNTRSTLTIKTVHNLGECVEEETDEDNL